MTPALYLVAVVCGLNLASGAWDHDCGNYAPSEPVQNCADAERMARWLSSSSPAGVRVIAWACTGPDTREARPGGIVAQAVRVRP